MNAKASNIFNSVIAGYIVAAFSKLGLFPRFEAGTTPQQLVRDYSFEANRLKTVLSAATTMGILKENQGTYRLTGLGKDLNRNRGFFTWAIGGYSPLLEAMDQFLTAPDISLRPYIRGEYVAIGSDECNRELMQPIFERVIDSLPAGYIADLGCGNAGQLVSLLRRRPELTGIGIDIDLGAIVVAKQNRDSHGLEDRLQLVQSNVFDTLTEPPSELQGVEIVMSFMMLHDLFNIKSLQNGRLFVKMKAAFPNAKYFLLADTCLDEQPHTADTMPIFTIGYELIHALRGIQPFPLEYYEKQFTLGGLKLVARHNLGVPNTYLFVLEVQ